MKDFEPEKSDSESVIQHKKIWKGRNQKYLPWKIVL